MNEFLHRAEICDASRLIGLALIANTPGKNAGMISGLLDHLLHLLFG